jgi:Double zinc ribbon
MDALAVFGISNDGLNLAVKLIILFLVAVWLALVFWTWADGRRRIEDPLLVGCAAAASFFFPYVGTVVYMIVRPPEYLEDVREREIEMAAARARLVQVQQETCPYCDYHVERSFLRCPSCLRKLKEPCTTCGRPLDPKWKICPYCEAEVPARAEEAPSRARRPARRAAGPSTAAAATADRPRPRPAPERDLPPRPRPPTRSTIDEPTAAHPAARPSPDEPPARRPARPPTRPSSDEPPMRRPTTPPPPPPRPRPDTT